MAKQSVINRNRKRRSMEARFRKKRLMFKDLIMNKTTSLEDRFAAQLELAKIPRNSCKIRIRNRCVLTGRPRGYYRKFDLSRIALRSLGSQGLLPGIVKASW